MNFRCIVLKICEVNMKMVERWLKIEISANLRCFNIILRFYNFKWFCQDTFKQGQVRFVQFLDGFDVSICGDSEKVERFFLSVPFVVWQEDEIAVFIDYLVNFLFVLQNVVDSVNRELFFCEVL